MAFYTRWADRAVPRALAEHHATEGLDMYSLFDPENYVYSEFVFDMLKLVGLRSLRHPRFNGNFLVLELTGSPVAVGALALVQTLPVTVLALVGGTIADRVNLRRLVITCESALAAIAALLAFLALTGMIEGLPLLILMLIALSQKNRKKQG